jgi:hypothetical protein
LSLLPFFICPFSSTVFWETKINYEEHEVKEIFVKGKKKRLGIAKMGGFDKVMRFATP